MGKNKIKLPMSTCKSLLVGDSGMHAQPSSTQKFQDEIIEFAEKRAEEIRRITKIKNRKTIYPEDFTAEEISEEEVSEEDEKSDDNVDEDKVEDKEEDAEDEEEELEKEEEGTAEADDW
jgi:hypothetical protein